MTPMSASKEPSIEEAAHVALRQALDSFEKVIISAMAMPGTEITTYKYAVYLFLASEINDRADSMIDTIAKTRGGKL